MIVPYGAVRGSLVWLFTTQALLDSLFGMVTVGLSSY